LEKSQFQQQCCYAAGYASERKGGGPSGERRVILAQLPALQPVQGVLIGHVQCLKPYLSVAWWERMSRLPADCRFQQRLKVCFSTVFGAELMVRVAGGLFKKEAGCHSGDVSQLIHSLCVYPYVSDSAYLKLIVDFVHKLGKLLATQELNKGNESDRLIIHVSFKQTRFSGGHFYA